MRQLGIITPASPVTDEDISVWQVKPLADPQFGTPHSIDLLLGADLLPDLLRVGNIQQGGLSAQKTAVGWTISGRIKKQCTTSRNGCHSLLADTTEPAWHRELIEALQRFWEMEDVPSIERKSALHEACETSFSDHRRTADGKYIVRLPLLTDAAKELGNSEASAQASLASLHRRMKRDARLAVEYRRVMDEYIKLGHMRAIPEEELQRSDRIVNYIPHHGIWQHSDGGDRLRVVFNASRPTSSGKSFNDIVHRGPKLQTDIWVILLRWRTHRIAFCADIKMMYRQIWIDEKDVDLQRILWSPSEHEPIQHYQLLTVTYGTSCAPYLALRTVQQLCNDEGQNFPRAVEAALKDRYVDDILSAAHDIDDALLLRNQLIQLLRAGGFPLRKWVANRPELLQGLDESDCLRSTWISFTAENPVSELGITWNPQADLLGLCAPHSIPTERSKRKILSVMASIFDPCGWLAPATLMTKMLLQDLWRAALNWDEELPTSMSRRWDSICEGFSAFAEVSLPRWISTKPGSDNTKLHVFSDTSRRAMAAVVYSRTATSGNVTFVHLWAAKTKLVPIRSLRLTLKPTPRMTIPRLDLRAALLAARLLHRICVELNIPIDGCYAWCDYQIVLHWIRSVEPTGNSIVDGYVHQIQELSPTSIWRYVPTDKNPADIASRGIDTKQLVHHDDWFHGPDWLAWPSSEWPSEQQSVPKTSNHCVEDNRQVLANVVEPNNTNYIARFSNLFQLLRFLARLRRWIRKRQGREPILQILEPLTPLELNIAFQACVRVAPRASFSTEIALLEKMQAEGKRRQLPGKGPLIALDPFWSILTCLLKRNTPQSWTECVHWRD